MSKSFYIDPHKECTLITMFTPIGLVFMFSGILKSTQKLLNKNKNKIQTSAKHFFVSYISLTL